MVDATHAPTCEIPVVGRIDIPSIVLIRPDGHVAWVGDDEADPSLGDAITMWFGRANTGQSTLT